MSEEAAHADFVSTLRTFVETVADRLAPERVASLLRHVDHGEEGLALGGLAATLSARRPTLTSTEWDTLHRLLYHYDVSDLDPEVDRSILDREAVLASLTVVDR